MTIIEAIKSGKRFKRRGQDNLMWSGPNPISITIDVKSLLSDDWEVEEKKVEITKAQLTKAWHRVMDRHTRTDSLHRPLSPCAYELAEELGLD